MLHAQVIPGVNSKAGAMIVPEGKVVMGIKNISFKRDSMFDGSDEVTNPQIEYLPFGKPKIHVGVGVSILAHYNLKEYQPLEKTRVVARVGYLF